ncbi:MAG: helix-hairpin-helix domain-containing protein [Candidatus Omnitrophota bacterium]
MILLTPHERRALVFSCAVFLLGLCLHVVFKLYPRGSGYLTLLDRPPARLVVDVNRASYDELLKVPGVGPTVAARIIYAREARRFASLDELGGIKGFSRKNLARAVASLVVGAP